MGVTENQKGRCKTTERGICRPGGFSSTEELLRLAELDGAEERKTVLDVGCGEGATIGYLRRRFPNWEVCGIDPNPAVRAEGMIETGRAEALPFSDQSMDVVLMECSFSRTQMPEKALSEVFRVLKPEGTLLMSDMYARKQEMAFDGMLGRLDSHRRIWRFLRDAGFDVVKMQDVSPLLAEWIGQQIMDGRGAEIYEKLGADRTTLKKAGCGYFVCAAKPSKLWETLRYAGEKSPYYREKWAGASRGTDCSETEDSEAARIDFSVPDWTAFRKLPFTPPEDIRENPERFLCVPAKEIARIITLRTSGSQGKPKRLFFTEEDLLQTADFFEKGIQYMVSPGDRVTVYMEGPGRFSIGGLLKEGLSRIDAEVTVHGLIRDMETAARDGEGRDCFVGVPSQMYGLAVQAPQLRPRTVLLSADYVPESVKDFLEKTWHCLVFTHWGMTETGYGGGVQCGAREGYHLRDDDLLMEIIDPDTGRPVPEGEYGEIVLTTLRRKGMPLIRYRTGDLGRYLTGPCGCGCLKPRLDKVKGRLDDAIRLPEGKLLTMHALDELLLSSGAVKDFEAAYDAERKILCVDVMENGNGAQDERLAALKTMLEDQFGGGISVIVRRKYIFPYIGSGKRKLRLFIDTVEC